MADVREKARKKAQQLVNLALSASSNEAENAALLAVRLISQHDLLSVQAPARVNVSEVIVNAQAFVKDPEVQRTVASATELLQGLSKIVGRKR